MTRPEFHDMTVQLPSGILMRLLRSSMADHGLFVNAFVSGSFLPSPALRSLCLITVMHATDLLIHHFRPSVRRVDLAVDTRTTKQSSLISPSAPPVEGKKQDAARKIRHLR